MTILLKKFGTTLISRQAGKEAYAALQPLIRGASGVEIIEVDFDGVVTFSPSWGAEFLLPLIDERKELVVLRNTQNVSVRASLKLLQDVEKKSFNVAG